MDLKIKNNSRKNIFIKTFGCQMNEYDSNRILDIARKINYYPTDDKLKADCYIINTCHIREKATEKVFHDIGRVKKYFRNKKKPILIITGCVAQAEGDLILKNEKYVDAVIGPQSYHTINDIIKNIETKKKQHELTNFNTIEKFDELKLIKNKNSKISSFLTVQEGCDKFCKFCVVPYTRGPEHSRNFEDIIKEADQLILNGSKEITLIGQNVNAYQYKNKRLSDLIIKLNEKKELKRIRYTTSHPKDMTDDLIEVHKSCKKLMPLLHLPVQSGSDKILKAINRRHNIKEYLLIVKKLKEKNSKIKFTSDFIIAYPGETEQDFELSCKLMQEVMFINSYSFLFSPRPGTPASDLKLVNDSVAKKRLLLFQNLADKVKFKYKKSLLNKTLKILFENKVEKDKYFGRDEFQNSVIIKSKKDLVGLEKNIIVKKFSQQTIFGELIESDDLAA